MQVSLIHVYFFASFCIKSFGRPFHDVFCCISGELWKGDLHSWANYKLILFSAAILLIVPVWIVFSLPLDNKYNKTPLVRFICNLTSHIYFMIIQILVACWPFYPIYRDSIVPNWIEWLLVVWLSGLLLEQLSEQQDRSGLAIIKVITFLSTNGNSLILIYYLFLA